MKRVLVGLLLLTFTLVGSSTIAASAETSPVNFLLPCKSNETLCIESISARLPDGSSIKGLTTGRTRNEIFSADDSFLKYLRGEVAEWNFPGLTFQNGTS